MDKICAFTIVAKNYIGLGEVLAESFKKHNPTADFWIFVADELGNTNFDNHRIIEAKSTLHIDNNLWTELAFKYNLTEFCTSIKPKAFEYLFDKKGYKKVIYLDPDIYCYSSFAELYNLLDSYKIIVTPHLTSLPASEYRGDLPEYIFLGMGTFNLGFLGLRKSNEVDGLLKWWHRVLSKECFMDKNHYTATDQKWMNYLPMFFCNEDLFVVRNRGINAAPWNFFEREFTHDSNGEIFVRSRLGIDTNEDKLLFVHFSNYKYAELSKGILKHYTLKYAYPDLELIFNEYISKIRESNIDNYITLPYSYNTFSNGKTISLFNRRLYRRLLVEGNIYKNPFDENGNFYKTLKRKKLLSKSTAITTTVRGFKSSRNENKANKVMNFTYRLLHRLIGIDRFTKFSNYISRKSQFENEAFLYDNSIIDLMK